MKDIEIPWPRDIDPVSKLMQKMSDACWLELFNARPRSLLPECRINNETEMSYPLIGNPVSAQELKAYMEDMAPRIKTITQQTAEGRRLSRRLEHRMSEKTFPPRNPCKRKELKERKALLRRKMDAKRREGARLKSLRKLNGFSVRMDSELEHRRLACCLGS